MKNKDMIYTYDVCFDDDNNSNNKGFKETLNYCIDWIENNKNSDQYFKDYKGGFVSIVRNETSEIMFEQLVK